MKRITIVVAAAAALLMTGVAPAADFALSFTGCPTGRVVGNPGETLSFDVFATLTSSNNAGPDGAQGWSLSVAVAGASVKAVTIKGVTVNTLFDEDEDPTTPLADVPLDLGTADFKVAQKAVGVAPVDPTVNGIVSAIVLNNTIKRVLRPEGTENICKITIDVVVPEPVADACVPSPISLTFLDGLKGAGQPVKNVVTFGGASQTPTSTNCSFEVCPRVITKEFNLALHGPGQTPAADGDTVLAVEVAPGAPSTHLVVASLTTANLPGPDGPQGWSISVGHDPCMIVPAATSVSIKGVIVNTLFDEDEDPTTPLAEVPLDLGTADFKVAQRATGADPSPLPDDAAGVVSAIVLNNTIKRVLVPNVSDVILNITYEVPAVAEGETRECRASFVNGLKGAGQPVNNVITLAGASNAPTKTQGLVLRVTGRIAPKDDSFSRGDANDDGKLDIADAVWIVHDVVPALDGPDTKCKDAADVNGDGNLDLVDAVYVIDYEFRGGPAPVAPFPGCAKLGTPEAATTCPEGSTSNC